ncbi:TonB-dependent receptor [Flavobacterium amnicola]|uniref:TonB-dependent receptor n=1 Tax=Flavobacterium amnicola TaxID=2506422 RepID=A0A4Q1K5J4_9FLAO|nr:TonB-dependent receptor [Flavobacterium amnicola]RXR20887.1 TonB-dependent receptor [Flavobacterium amnicola]
MKKLVFSTLLVLQAILAFAQQPTGISGKVIDSKSNLPLQNVVATIQNTNLTQMTGADGKFVLTNVKVGSQLLLIKSNGYKEQLLPIEILANQVLDLGVVVLEEDIQTNEQQLSLVTITENDLGDDNSGSESTSGLLQASRDAYQQAAAFNWGGARFRIRGLDNEYGTTMINGVVMNKIYDGRPQWGNWGGLNDATRNQEFTMGSAPSDYTFGGILGTQEINTRASIYRPGTRISFSGTNTNYNWRAMGTHASGLDSKGWAYVVSAGRRWAQEAYFQGTDYSANSIFASVEKRFGKRHALNFTSIYAQNSRGKTSPNTDEVNNLKGYKYNSYWGWQNGEKRNSRDKDIEEPIMMLSHYWKITDKTNLTTNVAYQTGLIGNSRLDYQGANSPDPTYYKYLPSYFNNLGQDVNEADSKAKFLANGQIDWDAMYVANQNSKYPGRALYALYSDRTDDKQISASSYIFSTLSDHITLNAGGTFRKLKSHNYQKMLDLLGATYFSDVDLFYQGDAAQTDLNNPDRKIYVGDEYGYNYNLNANVFDAFTQFKFTYKKADFYLAQTFSKSEYQRDGLYRNGIYAYNSFGKSKKVSFENFGFKGGVTYKITGQHLLDFNGAYITKAPNMRNTFANARINNNITPDLGSERVASVDASYIIKTPKFKSRLTAFASKVQNATELSFFYAEGVGEDTDADQDAFISELLTGLDKKNFGLELGLEYQLTSTIKASAAASYGQYLYANNPSLKINDDAQASITNPQPVIDFGKAYLKNYRLPGMPQTAASVGLEYRDPHFWWIGANYNYLADSYLDISNITRTDNFVTGSDGLGFTGATPESVAKILKQEKFDEIYLLNATAGKSWRVNSTTFGIFATANNILDKIYKTGGFEQSRKANYPDAVADNANGTPSFGSKYFYGYGRTYFVNLFVNF